MFPGRIARPSLAAEARKYKMGINSQTAGFNQPSSINSKGQQGAVTRDKPVIVTNEDGAGTWAKVVGRKAGRVTVTRSVSNGTQSQVIRSVSYATQRKDTKREDKRLARPPRTAAICVSAPPGSNVSAIQALGVARNRINLEELGMENVQCV